MCKATADHNASYQQVPIFDGMPRLRWLIGVAGYGPISNREIGRRVGVDSGSLPAYYRAFAARGVVTRDAAGGVVLNETFFAFPELAVFLHALAGRRVIVVPDERPTTVPKRLPALLGSAARTRTLVALDALGCANVADLAYAARARRQSVRAIVAVFARRGILRTERIAQEMDVSFAETPLTGPLRALLRRLADADRHLATVVAVVQQRVAERHPALQPAVPLVALPIGTPAQAAALAALARYGPLTTTHLSRLTNTDRHVVRSAVDVLRRDGFVVARTVGRGHGAARWVALNEAHPLTPPLRRYVLATTSAPAALVPLPPRTLKRSAPVRVRRLPGPPLRTATFLATYDAEELSIAALARRLARREHGSLRRWAEDLRTAGLVEYGPYQGQMTLRVLSTGTGVAELQDLARAMERFLRT